MTLLEVKNKYQELHKAYHEELVNVIESGCEKLIIMLNALKGKYPFPQIQDEYSFAKDNTWAINLRYIARIGIRYCGQFINMIIVSKNDKGPASERIRLTYASYEDGNDQRNECYPDDMYFGEKADSKYGEITIEYDWDNFWNLLCSLKPFFENVNMGNMYGLMLNEISEESRKMSRIESDITELIGENMVFYMQDVFRRNDRYEKNNKKHIIMLPNNLSIRFKGKFHNCLILDNYAFSLGFIQDQKYIAEECYNQDPYTTADDFTRYLKEQYKLLHEVSFFHFYNGFSQISDALSDLIFLCGNDFEKLHGCKYLRQRDVNYIHTILTD